MKDKFNVRISNGLVGMSFALENAFTKQAWFYERLPGIDVTRLQNAVEVNNGYVFHPQVSYT